MLEWKRECETRGKKTEEQGNRQADSIGEEETPALIREHEGTREMTGDDDGCMLTAEPADVPVGAALDEA